MEKPARLKQFLHNFYVKCTFGFDSIVRKWRLLENGLPPNCVLSDHIKMPQNYHTETVRNAQRHFKNGKYIFISVYYEYQ